MHDPPHCACSDTTTQRDFSTGMSSKDEQLFYSGVRRFFQLLMAGAPLFALSRFVQGKLGLDWRRWLSEHLCQLYFSNRAFYALKIGYLPSAGKNWEAEGGGEGGGGAGKDSAPKKEEGGEEDQGGSIDNPVSPVSGWRISWDASRGGNRGPPWWHLLCCFPSAWLCCAVLCSRVRSLLVVGSRPPDTCRRCWCCCCCCCWW